MSRHDPITHRDPISAADPGRREQSQAWTFYELAYVRREAQAEAKLAYDAWCQLPGADGYAVYRAAQDRADSVADRRFEQPGAFSGPCRPGGPGHRPGTGAAAAGAACGRPKAGNRPGSLNEVTRATCDAAMVSTHIECARYLPSWPRR